MKHTALNQLMNKSTDSAAPSFLSLTGVAGSRIVAPVQPGYARIDLGAYRQVSTGEIVDVIDTTQTHVSYIHRLSGEPFCTEACVFDMLFKPHHPDTTPTA